MPDGLSSIQEKCCKNNNDEKLPWNINFGHFEAMLSILMFIFWFYDPKNPYLMHNLTGKKILIFSKKLWFFKTFSRFSIKGSRKTCRNWERYEVVMGKTSACTQVVQGWGHFLTRMRWIIMVMEITTHFLHIFFTHFQHIFPSHPI